MVIRASGAGTVGYVWVSLFPFYLWAAELPWAHCNACVFFLAQSCLEKTVSTSLGSEAFPTSLRRKSSETSSSTKWPSASGECFSDGFQGSGSPDYRMTLYLQVVGCWAQYEQKLLVIIGRFSKLET